MQREKWEAWEALKGKNQE
jgi:hypothetical protein